MTKIFFPVDASLKSIKASQNRRVKAKYVLYVRKFLFFFSFTKYSSYLTMQTMTFFDFYLIYIQGFHIPLMLEKAHYCTSITAINSQRITSKIL